jgi:hypothetical protein
VSFTGIIWPFLWGYDKSMNCFLCPLLVQYDLFVMLWQIHELFFVSFTAKISPFLWGYENLWIVPCVIHWCNMTFLWGYDKSMSCSLVSFTGKIWPFLWGYDKSMNCFFVSFTGKIWPYKILYINELNSKKSHFLSNFSQRKDFQKQFLAVEEKSVPL